MRTDSTARPTSHADPSVDAIPWVIEGIRAGIAGAAVIALFFAILDLGAEHPFWTPFVLGSAFFRNALPAARSAVDPALVVGYTGIHALVFVGFGLSAAFYLFTGSRTTGPLATRLALSAALFAGLEVVFVLFAMLFARGSLAMLGAGRVAVANALAAAAMAWLLCARADRVRRP